MGTKGEYQTLARALRQERLASELWQTEQTLSRGLQLVAGVDEAGRGCLAGPVFAAAVVLDGGPEGWGGVMDSKALSARQRESVYEQVMRRAVDVQVGIASAEEIDQLNILQASLLAMTRALTQLRNVPDLALVDGNRVPSYSALHGRIVSVVDGDARCLSIAAASVIAKVERDRHMQRLSEMYPGYGFEQHAGYGTRAHLDALQTYGPCREHRRTFAPVRQFYQVGLNLDG